MLSVDDYLDAARAATKSKSDRELSKLLGVSSGTVSQIRTKRIWPGDDLILRIAEAGNLDPEQALIDLNIWRNEGPARAFYERLSKTIAAAALALAAIIPDSGMPQIMAHLDQICPAISRCILYVITNLNAFPDKHLTDNMPPKRRIYPLSMSIN
jgi:transcriptional regulator with XRE-family HTH domain